ncbi:MAG: hypothetical protein JXR37_21160 [Kiritimatiellae bacterium]|nr:hypothetical protein [Kiritimatiellia bacterium]
MMKTVRILAVLVLAVLAGWCLFFRRQSAQWRAELRAEHEQAGALTERVERLTRDLRAEQALRSGLETALLTESNRADRAEAAHKEEQATHDPLRAQLTRLIEQQNRQAQELSAGKEHSRKLAESVKQAEAAETALKAEKEKLVETLARLAAEQKRQQEAEAALRTELTAERGRVAGLSNELDRVRTELDQARQKVEPLPAPPLSPPDSTQTATPDRTN